MEIKIIYAVLSILTVALVFLYGVGNKSNYVPTNKEENLKEDGKKDNNNQLKGGESDAPAN
jgi:hypothetical protein